MESRNKKYLLGGTIIGCLVLGFFFSKPILTMIYPRPTIIESPDAVAMARDITTYTQSADAIIIGDVNAVTDPYLRSGSGVTLQQDAQINVREVLKGDSSLKNIKVGDLAPQIEDGFSVDNVASLKGQYGILKPSESVLLFLGTNSAGEYVVFAGSYGKYLIDENNNVSSIGDFKMSLDGLKMQIETALKSPSPVHTPVPPLSQEI